MRLRLAPVVVALTAVAACSSSSSGGSPTATPPTPGTVSSGPTTPAQVGPTPIPASSGPTTPAEVDAALNQVLGGLRMVTGIGANSDLGEDGKALDLASNQLEGASISIANFHDVPLATRYPVSKGLARIGELLNRSGTCLLHQAAASNPDPHPCLAPLRQAEAKDAAIAHGLISLSAYGSVSPNTFETRLVTALRGG